MPFVFQLPISDPFMEKLDEDFSKFFYLFFLQNQLLKANLLEVSQTSILLLRTFRIVNFVRLTAVSVASFCALFDQKFIIRCKNVWKLQVTFLLTIFNTVANFTQLIYHTYKVGNTDIFGKSRCQLAIDFH